MEEEEQEDEEDEEDQKMRQPKHATNDRQGEQIAQSLEEEKQGDQKLWQLENFQSMLKANKEKPKEQVKRERKIRTWVKLEGKGREKGEGLAAEARGTIDYKNGRMFKRLVLGVSSTKELGH